MTGGEKSSHGFTIMEVIIVLAISVGMLSAVFYIFWGRQNQATFDQSIRQAQIDIQAQITSVVDGNYNYQNNFSCSDNSLAAQPSINGGSSSLGQNSGCEFIGKAINFQATTSSNPHQYASYTLVGRQCNIFSIPPFCSSPGNVYAGEPVALAKGTLNPTAPNDFSWVRLDGALTVQWTIPAGCGVFSSIGTVAFMTNPSNSQQVDLYPVCGSILGDNTNSMAVVDNINNSLKNSGLTPSSSSVGVCLASGTTNQSGLITISKGSGQLQTSLQIHNGNKTCS